RPNWPPIQRGGTLKGRRRANCPASRRRPRATLEASRHGGGNGEADMADMIPVTITGGVQGPDDGPGRRERFFIERAAAAEGDRRRARIGVGDAEATALAFSLQGQEFPRPMTYQLMASLLAAAGSGVRSVRVTAKTDGVFSQQ